MTLLNAEVDSLEEIKENLQTDIEEEIERNNKASYYLHKEDYDALNKLLVFKNWREGDFNLFLYAINAAGYNLQLSSGFLAKLYRYFKQFKQNNDSKKGLKAEKTLLEFQERTGINIALEQVEGPDGKLRDWTYVKHSSRRGRFLFEMAIIEIIERMKSRKLMEGDKLVSIYNGKTRTDKTDKAMLDKLIEEAKEDNDALKVDLVQELFLNYFNNLPVVSFNKIKKYIPEALAAIDDTYINYHGEEKRQIKATAKALVESQLDWILIQPKPVYKASERGFTDRLFSINPGLQGIPSYLRDIITQDWVEVDLKSAYLAIVAKVWESPEIEDYLKRTKSVWKDILPYMGESAQDDEMKKLYKIYLYALVFGMSLTTLKRKMDSEVGKGKYGLFIQHEVIDLVIKTRSKRINSIAACETWTTPKGKVIKVDPDEKTGNVLSILSLECSEMEMSLLTPVIEMAMDTNEFQVTLYHFDGLSLTFKNDKAEKTWIKRLVQAVELKADELGIYTTLEVKE